MSAPGETRTFRLDPQRYRALALRQLAMQIPFSIALVAGGAAFYWWLLRDRQPPVATFEGVVRYGLLIGLGTIGMLIWSVLRTAKGYQLLLGPDLLRVEVPGLAPIVVRRGEVTLVRERKPGLEIHRTSGMRVWVTRGLGGYDEVRDAVLAWSPAGAGPPSPARTWKGIATMVAFVGLFVFPGLSGFTKTLAPSLALAILAAGSGVWLSTVVRELPIKNKGFARAFCLILAASALILQAMRWTPLFR